jgi:predicted  nucleic acid-binding Zn-ribbon protein
MHELKRERTKMESEKDVLEQELLNTDTLLAEKREKVQAERTRVKQGEEQVAELKAKVGHL